MKWVKKSGLRSAVRDVGFIPRQRLWKVLAVADAFVQPGRSDAFNDYRFPSKLPDFLACGRPVILPATNIGRYLRDDVDALLLERGDADEIVEAVRVWWPIRSSAHVGVERERLRPQQVALERRTSSRS